MENKATIAFITYNRSEELIRAIESCLKNDSLNSKILIWDNASNAQNSNRVKDYVIDKSNVTYVYSEENLGVSGGRNAVWRLCATKYVLFLDDDATIESFDFVSQAIDYLENHPAVGAAGFDIFEPATSSKLICPNRFQSSDGLTEILNFVGACHLMNKDIYPYEKLYPDNLFFGSEELFACIALRGEGYVIAEIPDLKVYHMPSQINRYYGKERAQNFIVNQFVIKLMLYPFWLFPVFWLMFLVRNMKNGINILSSVKLAKTRTEKIFRRISTRQWFNSVRKYGFLINV